MRALELRRGDILRRGASVRVAVVTTLGLREEWDVSLHLRRTNGWLVCLRKVGRAPAWPGSNEMRGAASNERNNEVAGGYL